MSSPARNPRQIGNAIRRVRKIQKLSQKALGEKAGLRQETISIIENGNPSVKIGSLLKILGALGLEFQITSRSKSNHNLERHS